MLHSYLHCYFILKKETKQEHFSFKKSFVMVIDALKRQMRFIYYFLPRTIVLLILFLLLHRVYYESDSKVRINLIPWPK